MSLFKKKQRAEETVEASPAPIAAGSSWTKGRALLRNTLTAAVWAMIVAGAIGFVGQTIEWISPKEPAAAVVEQDGLTVGQQRAAGFALEFVSAWLSATKDDAAGLESYIDLSAVSSSLTEQAWTYRDLAVVSAEPAAEPFVTVVVSANVQETSYDADGNATESWPRRFFQVTVAVDGDQMKVVTLPSPVEAPAQGKAPTLAYTEQLSTSDPAGETTMQFLGAYLAGAGDLTRFISPDAAITAVSPAQFVQIDPVDMRSDVPPVESAGEGSQMRVLATVRGLNVDSRVLPASYALTLTMRAGRWEVSSVDLAPQVRVASDSAVPSTEPAPSTAPLPSTSATPTPTTTAGTDQ
ncbi:conjugal transfer protein [Microbacterium sediminis]|uniref:conjugal transfer protein n=1 Tax=Microbacterium sediminis TaxID=904291 RepID=UPI0010725F21|nr:conjugal transfer protein [Microbacterium sediminis]QBR75602.1 conjugal transfer protein [Microbacterium sediminis]